MVENQPKHDRQSHGGCPPLQKQTTWVLSLGGSLIFPDRIDTEFLRRFRAAVLKMVGEGQRFVIVTGGGALCRVYQNAAAEIVKVESDDLDWIGIHATRMNAHLLRTLFRKEAHQRVIKDPTEELDFDESILLVAGWKPGFSTDYDAVLLAQRVGSKTVINLTNVDSLYDRDPRKDPAAKPIQAISWPAYQKISGTEWKPGLHVPFDPIASKEAARSGLRVVITSGHDLENFERIVNGKPFSGSIIG